MSSWDILGGNGGDNNDEEVEYVGVIEEDAPQVQEPTRPVRRNVRRVMPRQMPMDQAVYPVHQNNLNRNGVVGAPNRDEEDLVSYVNMPYGKQLGLTPEAIDRLQRTPIGNINGQMSQRIEPGTYVMYGPSRADGLGEVGGLGTEEDDDDDGQQRPYGTRELVGDIMGAVGGATGVIVGAVSRRAEQIRELDFMRFESELARDARSEALQYGLQEAMLEQSTRLAEIEAGAAELEVLRAQAEAAAALQTQVPSTTSVAPSGTSPIIWILVALLGVGGIGGVIWAVSKKKKKDD